MCRHPGKALSLFRFNGLYQFQIKALSLLARLRLLNVLFVRLRRLNPHRLDFILDLKSVLLKGHAALLLLIQTLFHRQLLHGRGDQKIAPSCNRIQNFDHRELPAYAIRKVTP
jgi:hypothetical protein